MASSWTDRALSDEAVTVANVDRLAFVPGSDAPRPFGGGDIPPWSDVWLFDPSLVSTRLHTPDDEEQ